MVVVPQDHSTSSGQSLGKVVNEGKLNQISSLRAEARDYQQLMGHYGFIFCDNTVRSSGEAALEWTGDLACSILPPECPGSVCMLAGDLTTQKGTSLKQQRIG